MSLKAVPPDPSPEGNARTVEEFELLTIWIG